MGSLAFNRSEIHDPAAVTCKPCNVSENSDKILRGQLRVTLAGTFASGFIQMTESGRNSVGCWRFVGLVRHDQRHAHGGQHHPQHRRPDAQRIGQGAHEQQQQHGQRQHAIADPEFAFTGIQFVLRLKF